MANDIILVAVQTANGFDTKFLFPGLMPHQGHAAAGSSSWWYQYDVISKGEVAPFDKFGKHFHLFDNFRSATAIRGVGGDYDIQGTLSEWSISDAIDSSNATLAVVQFLIPVETSGSFPKTLNIPSMSWITPDSLISSAREQDSGIYFDIHGNVGNDTLRGSYWHDRLAGGDGRDSLLAGDGNDTLDGGAGADKMIGGNGDDRYFVDNKKDQVVEAKGEGSDTVLTTIDYVLGKNLESVLAQGSRSYTLTGNSANNIVEGADGGDTLRGLDGNDVLAGLTGKDVLYGGKGKDSFVFLTIPAVDKPDTIKDFNHHDDTIKVGQTAFAGLFPIYINGSNFPLPAERFHSSKSGKAHDGDDRIIYDTDDGKLYFDPDGNGAQHRVLFANLTGHPNVMADDIWVI